MAEKVTVTFFKINRCGYYKRAQSDPEFGSLTSLLGQLVKWSSALELKDTKLNEPEAGSDRMPVYLHGIENAGGNTLVSLWNEVQTTREGKLGSVPATAQVGQAAMVSNKIATGTIPGYPTYFWIVPSLNVLACIVPEGYLGGKSALQEYFQTFLETSSEHVVQVPATDDADQEIEVVSYRADVKSQAHTDVSPKFQAALYINPGQHDFLRKNVGDIRTLHRRADLVLKASNGNGMAFWQKALKIFDMGSTPGAPKKAKMRASLSVSLSIAELDAIIADWEKSNQAQEWSDYGFKLRKDPTIYWLSGARARAEPNLQLLRGSNGEIDRADLLRVLNANLPQLKANLQ